MTTAKHREPSNARFHVSSTCVACDNGAPCGEPSAEGFNACEAHLAAGDRRRIERALEPLPVRDKEIRVQARGRDI